ncbi:NUDIX domain-containing protein [Candidatus Gottesmanbacteria bacterium]|nr:NUDIX domain-containing protein [Candidatus Gottesmanbacteria bacterium]
MKNKIIKTGVAIVVTKENKILLGLLSKKWLYNNKQVYGVPGRDVRFGEKIGDTVKRNILEDLGCSVTKYNIFAVNSNYVYGNHYIEIGVLADIEGDLKNLMPVDWEKWEWFDFSHIPKNLFPSAKNVIDSYLKKVVNVEE